LGLVF
jgi:hypothetical protein